MLDLIELIVSWAVAFVIGYVFALKHKTRRRKPCVTEEGPARRVLTDEEKAQLAREMKACREKFNALTAEMEHITGEDLHRRVD